MNIKQKVEENAYAKINLGLDIIGKRSDGYHLLRMVMQTLKLHDTVTVSERDAGFGIKTVTDSDKVSDDSHNLAYRAAYLLKTKLNIEKGMEIHIEKRIPVAAGLAGGSSDAAAVLKGVNRLFSLGLDSEALKHYGVSLGADVPYCLEGGTKLSEGIGEILSPITPGLGNYGVLLIKPDEPVSTKEVYEAYDSTGNTDHPDTESLIKAIRDNDMASLKSGLSNVLEKVTLNRVPEIERIKEFLRGMGLKGVLMSGSGPTVFAIDEDRELLKRAEEEGRKHFPGTEIVLTETFEPEER